MHTIREALDKIRSLASAWLTDQTTDGSTAMGEVTATLLNTNFEEYTNEMEVRGPSTEELAAEIDSLLGRLETAKSIGIDACDQLIANRREQTPALRDVAAERLRQVRVEGRSPKDDDRYANGQLAEAAGCYALHAYETAGDLDGAPAWWPWEAKWFKLGEPRRNLVKAGALILAEIERLDRAEDAKKPANWDRTKPEWSSHDWPQIFQTSNGNWFGVRAGWDLKAHTSSGWKGDEVSLLSDDGKFLKYGEPSTDWRDSLEQRPVAELYTDADEARMDVVGQNVNDGEHYEPAVSIDQLMHAALPADLAAVLSPHWVEWTGELCPIDDLDAMVWVMLEGIDEVRPGIARNWDWRTEPAMGRSRIVAYRLTDPSVQP